MQGYASYKGERVMIVDVAGDQALITPGAPQLMQWVKARELDDITWVIP